MIGFGLGLWDNHGGAGFNPLTLSPALWLDASDASTLYTDSGLTTLVAADGDPVGGWQDKSGNSRHATQASGTNKPLYKTGVKNSKSILRFDGVNDALAIASSTAYFKFLHATEGSFFIVFRTNPSVSNPNTIYTFIDNNALGTYVGSSFSYDDRSANGFNDILANNGGIYTSFNFLTQTANNLATPGTWFSFGNKLKGQDATAANRSRIYLNGALNNAVNSNTGSNTNNAQYNLMIGSGQGSYPLNGDIAEIQVYSSALSDTNMTAVESYLNSKWSIY